MKRLLTLVVIFALSISVFGQKMLTLDDAIKIALNKNYSLITQKNQLDVTKASQLAAIGRMLPSLSVSSSAGWNHQESVRDYYGGALSTVVKTELRNYTLGASTSWTLFDGLSSWANLNSTSDNVKSAEFSIEQAKQDIVYYTENYFYSILAAQENVKVQEEQLKSVNKNLEQIKEKNRLGSSALSDVLQYQSNVAQQEYTLINAKNNLENARITFLNYLSLDVYEQYEFVDPKTVVSNPEDDLNNTNKLVQEALSTRKDYQSQLYSLDAAKQGTTTAWSTYLPTLRFQGSYGTTSTDASKMLENPTMNASLNLSWNISVTGFLMTDISFQSAKVNLLNAQEATRNMERQIKANIKLSIINYQTGIKSLEAAQTALKYAAESKRIVNEKYTLGSSTILDVLTSESSYLQSAYQEINARYQLYYVKEKLMENLGKLDYSKYESK